MSLVAWAWEIFADCSFKGEQSGPVNSLVADLSLDKQILQDELKKH